MTEVFYVPFAPLGREDQVDPKDSNIINNIHDYFNMIDTKNIWDIL